jgi:arsenite oxidase small subunit
MMRLMQRRDFLCEAAAASCASPSALGFATLASADTAWAAQAQPKAYAKALLTNALGDPIKASSLKPKTNYIFHYPFASTPVFLLDLGKSAPAATLSTEAKAEYAWPGGVGKAKSIVAFSAICAHQLVYPTPQHSFISFRPGKSIHPEKHGTEEGLIHCCADHSQYDPAKGAQVLRGPAPQPLCAVLLQHDPKADTLTAYATLGGELFDAFFKKYEMKLSLEVGAKAKLAVQGSTAVKELDQFCKNTVKC